MQWRLRTFFHFRLIITALRYGLCGWMGSKNCLFTIIFNFQEFVQYEIRSCSHFTFTWDEWMFVTFKGHTFQLSSGWNETQCICWICTGSSMERWERLAFSEVFSTLYALSHHKNCFEPSNKFREVGREFKREIEHGELKRLYESGGNRDRKDVMDRCWWDHQKDPWNACRCIVYASPEWSMSYHLSSFFILYILKTC